MPRDYKYRVNQKQKPKGAPAWVWMLTGLLLGAFAVGLIWLKMDSPPSDDRWVTAPPDRAPQGGDEPRKPAEVPPHKPRFEFFDKLGRQEVMVPEEQLDLRPDPAADDATAQYLIQAGSFAKTTDAERMRAELALLGIETRVSEARLQNGQVVHRVVAGPYLGREALDKARGRLKQNGYRQLLVRIIR